VTTTALVLLSGGLDSTTLLAQSLADCARVEALFVNYGQRHIRERESSRKIADRYGLRWDELDLTQFGASVRSALTSPDVRVPHGHYTAASMRITVVPNRNATLLSAAAGIAASRNLEVVRTAVHAGDHAVYADCRPEFIDAINLASRLGCEVGVEAPFVEIDKTAIAALAHKLDAPIELTWSCYEGGQRNANQHCGRCGTCVERAEALHDAGVPDPTDYADREFWKQAVANA
jgi:7-cyano-7-deazaguanine synthase